MAVKISGSAISSILLENLNKDGDQEGFLLGKTVSKVTTTISDAQINNRKEESSTCIQSYLPSAKTFMFYDGKGRIQEQKLHCHLTDRLKDVVGWYRFRRSSHFLVSMRERTIHGNLSELFRDRGPGQFLFFLITADGSLLEHACYQYNNGQFTPIGVELINLGDTSKSEYKQQTAITGSLYNRCSYSEVLNQYQVEFMSVEGSPRQVSNIRDLNKSLSHKLMTMSGSVAKTEVILDKLGGEIKALTFILRTKEEEREKRNEEERATVEAEIKRREAERRKEVEKEILERKVRERLLGLQVKEEREKKRRKESENRRIEEEQKRILEEAVRRREEETQILNELRVREAEELEMLDRRHREREREDERKERERKRDRYEVKTERRDRERMDRDRMREEERRREELRNDRRRDEPRRIEIIDNRRSAEAEQLLMLEDDDCIPESSISSSSDHSNHHEYSPRHSPSNAQQQKFGARKPTSAYSIPFQLDANFLGPRSLPLTSSGNTNDNTRSVSPRFGANSSRSYDRLAASDNRPTDSLLHKARSSTNVVSSSSSSSTRTQRDPHFDFLHDFIVEQSPAKSQQGGTRTATSGTSSSSTRTSSNIPAQQAQVHSTMSRVPRGDAKNEQESQSSEYSQNSQIQRSSSPVF